MTGVLLAALQDCKIAVVEATQRLEVERPESPPGTLGDVLHAGQSKAPASEKDWVRLVRSIAVGDRLALHALYDRTHRVVFTLIMRITCNRETWSAPGS